MENQFLVTNVYNPIQVHKAYDVIRNIYGNLPFSYDDVKTLNFEYYSNKCYFLRFFDKEDELIGDTAFVIGEHLLHQMGF